MNPTNKYLVQVFKDGRWLTVESNRTEAAAYRSGKSSMKLTKSESYRVVGK